MLEKGRVNGWGNIMRGTWLTSRSRERIFIVSGVWFNAECERELEIWEVGKPEPSLLSQEKVHALLTAGELTFLNAK